MMSSGKSWQTLAALAAIAFVTAIPVRAETPDALVRSFAAGAGPDAVGYGTRQQDPSTS